MPAAVSLITSLSEVQSVNTSLSSVITLQLDKSTVVSEVQPTNALRSMMFSEESGMAFASSDIKQIFLRFLQSLKALSEMFVTDLGIMTISTFSLSLNASSPITLMALSLGMVRTRTPSSLS